MAGPFARIAPVAIGRTDHRVSTTARPGSGLDDRVANIANHGSESERDSDP